jgi:hypothetical protein
MPAFHCIAEKTGLAVTVLFLLAACSSSPDAPGRGGSTGGSSGSGGAGARGGSNASNGGSSSSGGGVATGSGGSGGTPGTDGSSTDTPATLPFAVDQYYVASGFMGDGATDGLIVADNTCQTPRPAGAVGQCYRFTYHKGAMGWGGVYWQYPANNWGTSPGKRIAPGATKIRFYAAGAQGGEPVSFITLGINDPMGTYHDPPTVTVVQTLTTTMTPYEINLTGQTYDAVIGGFGWVAPPAGATLQQADGGPPLVFDVDGIEWE